MEKHNKKKMKQKNERKKINFFIIKMKILKLELLVNK